MSKWYRQDLAYIHDVGHSDYALKSAPDILKILTQYGIREGLIVDLGCGSGWSAQAFVQAGYRVFGVDLSKDLVAIACSRVPEATFQVNSLYHVGIPPCHAVTAIGECLNYWFVQDYPRQNLMQLFRRVYQALAPKGIFIFDIAEPGQVTTEGTVRSFSEGQDWMVLLEKAEDEDQAILTRRITTLRKVDNAYRRDDEIHYLKLYRVEALVEDLHQVGFEVAVQNSYGEFNLPPAHTVLIAHKPNYG